MSKVDELRAMRERAYEARQRAGTTTKEERVVAKRPARKAPPKPKTQKTPRGEAKGALVSLRIKKPLTQKGANALLAAASTALAGGATLEGLLTSLNGSQHAPEAAQPEAGGEAEA